MDLKIIAPCVNCITKPICRHKSYYNLVTCPLLKELYHEIFFDPDSSVAARDCSGQLKLPASDYFI
jgi:hypothetical protein